MAIRPPLSRTKKLVYSAIIVTVLVVAIELLASLAGTMLTGQRFSRARLQRQRHALIASGGLATAPTPWAREGVLHPYVGYVPVPRSGEAGSGVGGAVAAHPPTRRAGTVTVAFVGGSFAVAFAEHGAQRLLGRLSELPAYRGKTLVPLNLAAGGYKQPQQLMSVAYLLTLGGEIDLLVNLDGFNEITLYPTENAQARVFPAFPRAWHRHADAALPGGTIRLMLRRVQLEQRRLALAGTFAAWPWQHLNLANLLYLALDRDLERKLDAADRQLLGAEQATGARPVDGPPLTFASEAEMLAHLVGLWQRSSRLIDQLARAGGARYYHFLQPNQYVPDGKPMGPAERATALVGSGRYAALVRAGYPMLRRAGGELRAEGVRFVDLSGAFAGHAEPLYIDGCCHVGPPGNAIVADLIFDAIRRDLGPPPAATPR